LGTSEDPQDKATKDYKNRTDDPRNVNPAETTFVFATPRPFGEEETKKQKWIEERKKQGVWADIRIVDGIDLEAWLEEHEAVAARFATQVAQDHAAERRLQRRAFLARLLRASAGKSD
jgi:hypothetical protein